MFRQHWYMELLQWRPWHRKQWWWHDPNQPKSNTHICTATKCAPQAHKERTCKTSRQAERRKEKAPIEEIRGVNRQFNQNRPKQQRSLGSSSESSISNEESSTSDDSSGQSVTDTTDGNADCDNSNTSDSSQSTYSGGQYKMNEDNHINPGENSTPPKGQGTVLVSPPSIEQRKGGKTTSTKIKRRRQEGWT